MSSGFQVVPAEVFGSGAQQAFIPGPMMMGMGYPMGMRPAMVKPVQRPITIQAPPDAQAAAGRAPSKQHRSRWKRPHAKDSMEPDCTMSSLDSAPLRSHHACTLIMHGAVPKGCVLSDLYRAYSPCSEMVWL